jgi:tRNA A37 threonylcarbamoyladenosine biosynthesis protein TsaE
MLDCVIIEWPEIIKDFLPKKRIDIFLEENRDFKRSARVRKIEENE